MFREGICRTPPGVRELKLWLMVFLDTLASRTPPGVRELKLERPEERPETRLSHPSRGA